MDFNQFVPTNETAQIELTLEKFGRYFADLRYDVGLSQIFLKKLTAGDSGITVGTVTGSTIRTGTAAPWAYLNTNGIFAESAAATAAFAVAVTDGNSWGGLTLDKGDVLLGKSTAYILWDASAASITLEAASIKFTSTAAINWITQQGSGSNVATLFGHAGSAEAGIKDSTSSGAKLALIGAHSAVPQSRLYAQTDANNWGETQITPTQWEVIMSVASASRTPALYTTASGWLFQSPNDTTFMQMSNTGIIVGSSLGQLGFFSAAGRTKPTVGGSRANTEQALKTLLSALNDFNLISDTTTA